MSTDLKTRSTPSAERRAIVMAAFQAKIKKLERGTSPQRLKMREEYLAMKAKFVR